MEATRHALAFVVFVAAPLAFVAGAVGFVRGVVRRYRAGKASDTPEDVPVRPCAEPVRFD